MCSNARPEQSVSRPTNSFPTLALMRISIRCPECQARFSVGADKAGKKLRCGRESCQAVFLVPELDEFESHEKPLLRSSNRRPSQASQRSGASRRSKSVQPTGKAPVVLGVSAIGLVCLIVIGFLWLRPGDEPAIAVLDAAPLVAAEPPRPNLLETTGASFVQKFCADCHSGDEPDAGVSVADLIEHHDLARDRKGWTKALEVVDSNYMPPPEGEQPSMEERLAFVAAIEGEMDRIDCAKGPDPGRVTVRRLNRAEYNNTVRDLLGVTIRPADDFPSDDVGYGFDNIGDVLSLPPLLLEKYLAAAEQVAAASIIVIDPDKPTVKSFGDEELIKSPVVHPSGSGWVLVSNGELGVEFSPPIPGEYELVVDAWGQRAGDDLPKMEIRQSGNTLESLEVKATRNKSEVYRRKVQLTSGPQKLAIAFVNDYYDEAKKADRNLYVESLSIRGPLTFKESDLPERHRQLVAHLPSDSLSASDAIARNLEGVASKAFRRPLRKDELRPIVELGAAVAAETGNFNEGMRAALTAVLVSPHFLFRWELDSRPDDPTATRPLTPHELASRLSYFLWSSMPDDELRRLADSGELANDDVLDVQVYRMLKDPKAIAIVDGFAEQWLQLRILNEVTPDPEKFPGFTDDLRRDMFEETRLFFASIIREDGSLLDLLNGRYTFLNERLAKHYGIAGVSGNAFQKVLLEGTDRVGVLTHGSILTMTSNPNRTSPVKRGKWVMEVLLDQPPPPAPPNVPELGEVAKAKPDATLREQLEIHRADPSCASCHRTMDELGFGMEGFDAIGRFREKDEGGRPLDTSGLLPGGDHFTGSRELSATLEKRTDRFAMTLSEKMLTYALGRGSEYYDRCTLKKILLRLSVSDYRFSVLVSEIVKSDPFRLKRGEE